MLAHGSKMQNLEVQAFSQNPPNQTTIHLFFTYEIPFMPRHVQGQFAMQILRQEEGIPSIL